MAYDIWSDLGVRLSPQSLFRKCYLTSTTLCVLE
ncbi:uncharacterized protein METZ01_LOCUS479553, partial [marine metagenome]